MADSDEGAPGSSGTADDAGLEALVDALLDGDRSQARVLLAAHLDRTGSFLETVDGLVQPAMAEVGNRWEEGEVSVADEHLATATMQTVVAQALADLPLDARPEGGGTLLAACVEGNDHALGLRVLSDAFELAGWRTRCLGADIPTDALVSMVERWRPDVLALSVSLEEQVPAAREVVDRVRALGGVQPTVLAGGPLDERELPRSIGVDAWATSVGDGLRAARA